MRCIIWIIKRDSWNQLLIHFRPLFWIDRYISIHLCIKIHLSVRIHLPVGVSLSVEIHLH